VKSFFVRNKGVISYLVVVIAAVVAVDLHHTLTTNELRDNARMTCVALEEVTENQEFVMTTLTYIIARQSAIDPTPELLDRLGEIAARIQRLPKYDCRSDLRQVR